MSNLWRCKTYIFFEFINFVEFTSIRRQKAIKILKCVSQNGKTLNHTIISKTKILDVCKEIIVLAATEKNYLSEDFLKELVEVLKFVSICVSYGHFTEICDDLFQILSGIFSLPFKLAKFSQVEEIKLQFLASKFSFDIMRAYILICKGKKKEISQLRSFVENDCIIFMKNIIEMWDDFEEVRFYHFSFIIHRHNYKM